MGDVVFGFVVIPKPAVYGPRICKLKTTRLAVYNIEHFARNRIIFAANMRLKAAGTADRAAIKIIHKMHIVSRGTFI